MNNLIENIFNYHERIFQVFIIIFFSVIISFFASDKTIHSFSFQKGSNWLYEDLYADFDFSIFKTEEELKKNKQAIQLYSDVYYEKDTLIKKQSLLNFELDLKSALKSKKKVLKYYEIGESIFTKLYNNGIIDLRKEDLNKESVFLISPEYEEFKSQNAKKVNLISLFSFDDALKIIDNEIKLYYDGDKLLKDLLINSLDHNINFNSYFSNLILEQEYEKISFKKGLIKEGELIIKKNQLIDSESFQKLHSYKKELNNYLNQRDYKYIFLGNFMFTFLIILICYLFLTNYYKSIIISNASFLFISSIILFFVCFSTFIGSFDSDLVFAIPFCIIPLSLRAFFDLKISLFVHFFIILIISFLCSKSQLFFVIYFLAGISSVLSPKKIYTQSKLMFTILRIVLVFFITLISILLLTTGSLDQVDFKIILMLCLSAVLTFLTFPFIYVCEKVFNLISDLSLLEYADTNTELLRKLAKEAPGTFHHSLQVSHLCESVAIEIDANPLLVRAGALYHDIGKLSNPNFFIENQSTSFNPHDDLSFDESAKLIIDHVIDGIEIAKKYNLPDQLIDFIRTHHGDYLMQYFYKEYLKNFPDNEDEKKFRYPGPKPFNKETAILMMCDSVEAASRSLKLINTSTINKLVDSVISSQFKQNQYDNSSLTFKEINQIKTTLKLKLKDIYHTRISYPEQ